MPCFFAQLQRRTWLLTFRGMSEESRLNSPLNGRPSRFKKFHAFWQLRSTLLHSHYFLVLLSWRIKRAEKGSIGSRILSNCSSFTRSDIEYSHKMATTPSWQELSDNVTLFSSSTNLLIALRKLSFLVLTQSQGAKSSLKSLRNSRTELVATAVRDRILYSFAIRSTSIQKSSF